MIQDNFFKVLKNNISCLLIFIVLSVCCSSTAFARDVSFTWTANTDTIDGYVLYYKIGSNNTPPYDGVGALEGNSPVSVGNVTSFTLHNLSDIDSYVFVITATNGTFESDYSQDVVVGLITPAINSIEIQ